ncbi:hypothetical protein [Tepidimonas aquatica]|uniref:Uncharacterized protein n=1 Tax=Tepidimonas aquatica TaxID=247482 RepID=A0A554WP22_9BURK|nr:hypothetical protein [Tepidimonas aquatica]TSE25328.1 hypothetical protein Taqua_01072 [Tepidimonas aquatica]
MNTSVQAALPAPSAIPRSKPGAAVGLATGCAVAVGVAALPLAAVAGEVRQLAQRSSQAAREIKDLHRT